MKNREKVACKFRLRTSTYILLHNTVYILKSFCVFFFYKNDEFGKKQQQQQHIFLKGQTTVAK